MKAIGGFSKRNLKKRKGRLPNDGLIQTVLIFVSKSKRIVDIGSGIGQCVESLLDKGYKSIGIDGSEEVEKVTNGLVKFLDLSVPIQPDDEESLRSEWGLFIEVGEHIPKEFESVVISNINKLVTEGLIVSWAVPKQRGRGHVNCQPPEYIASEFEKFGWVLDEVATELAKQICEKSLSNRLMILRKDHWIQK